MSDETDFKWPLFHGWFTLRESEGQWCAHEVALDLVACDADPEEAIETLHTVIMAQIRFGLKHGRTLRQCYFAAPPEYWKPPFISMFVTPEQFAEFDRHVVESWQQA